MRPGRSPRAFRERGTSWLPEDGSAMIALPSATSTEIVAVSGEEFINWSAKNVASCRLADLPVGRPRNGDGGDVIGPLSTVVQRVKQPGKPPPGIVRRLLAQELEQLFLAQSLPPTGFDVQDAVSIQKQRIPRSQSPALDRSRPFGQQAKDRTSTPDGCQAPVSVVPPEWRWMTRHRRGDAAALGIDHDT